MLTSIPQSFSAGQLSRHSDPSLEHSRGVVVISEQDLALSLVDPHTNGLGSLIQPVLTPLQILSALQKIHQLDVICELRELSILSFIWELLPWVITAKLLSSRTITGEEQQPLSSPLSANHGLLWDT